MDYIENKTFAEIEVGDTASLCRVLSMEDIQLFAVMSGDVNPAHLDVEFAKSEIFQKIIAHGMWGGALISTLLGTKLPGPGTIYLGQTLRFKRPVALGDTITVSVTATEKNEEKKRITFDCECVNQNDKVVISGSAEVLAPTKKIKRARTILPKVHLHDPGARFKQLIESVEDLEPIRMAVVHPIDRYTLLGAHDAAQAGLIIPVLVGPEAKIKEVADMEAIDISAYQIVSTEYSHSAVSRAVSMARSGEVAALMKGRLTIEELMKEVVARYTGLRTEQRISHVSILDVPTHPCLLFITDTAVNIYPTLADKPDIVQNAIDLALALGVEEPKVAILSAIETVSPRLQSSLEAAALCKMADRGQITGGIVDGPLAFDDAISLEVSQMKGLNSPVAGHADILVAPDLESGSMMAKQLEHLADALVADVVVGARVPIVLTEGGKASLPHLASCAVALKLVRQKRPQRAEPRKPGPIIKRQSI